MSITRREFIKGAGAMAALSASGLSVLALPRISFASLPTDNRFILVILRGALDGLAAVPAYGDKNYAAARRGLALPLPGQVGGITDLNGYFGLNPAMASLQPLYQSGQLLVVHAVSSPYRERSHFDAQNLLENGTDHTGGTNGWLNRALFALKADPGAGMVINQQVPLVLQGQFQATSWAPKGQNVDTHSEYMQRMSALYAQDSQLAPAFSEAIQTQEVAASTLSEDDKKSGKGAKGPEELYNAARACATFLTKENGPRVCVLEAAGWDTHFRQGTTDGQLAQRLGDLARGLAALPQAMGPVWKKTVVVVVTEFGRTVAENGTGGTDHGTGGMSIVMGGGIKGGQVLGQWPGLASGDLYQGRDLMPTTDMRSIFKTVLYAHLKAPNDALNNVIFPNSANAPVVGNLLA